MTEFVISASFFLIPLFLGMSVLAKYIDIKQANIQAARYEAWEYTVWYANINERSYLPGNTGEVMSGFDAFDQPKKTTTQTRIESKQRFYTNPGSAETTSPILATDRDTGWSAAAANPLWTDHTGAPLYSGVDGAYASLATSEDTPSIPVVGKIVDTLFDVIGFVFEAMHTILSLGGLLTGVPEFNAINTDGYVKSTASMELSTSPMFTTLQGDDVSLDGTTDNTLDISTTATVLSDNWNAGGKEHTYMQAGGAVPSALLNGMIQSIPGLADVWNVVSILAPEFRLCHPGGLWGPNDKGSLWLGHIDIDAVHPDRLIDPATGATLGTHVVNAAGMSDFSPDFRKTSVDPDPYADSRDCVQ
jgi:hypothetical protein